MSLEVWLIYSIFALINIVSPRPAVLLAISNSIIFNINKVIYSSLGNIVGLLIISTVTILGLGALLKTSTILFTILKFLGAFYLIYLGVKQFYNKTNIFLSKESLPKIEKNYWKTFLQGFLVAVTNPKPILFFTAFFPQFINKNTELLPQFFIMISTFISFSFLVLMTYALFANYVKLRLANQHYAIWFNKISGGFFVAMGIALLKLKNNPSQ